METPLEALAFNYASFGIFTVVNNLWTWIAIVTVAVSVWRFKATVTYHHHHHSPPPVHEVLSSSSYENCKKLENDVKGGRHQKPSLPKVEDEKINAPSLSPSPRPTTSSSTTSRASSSTSTTSTWPSFCEDGVTKGRKFMACYRYEVQENDDVVVEKENFGEKDEEGINNNVFDVREKLRMKEMGLFDFQDLRMLNGNIVRLWDDSYACSNSRSSSTFNHLLHGNKFVEL